MGEMIVQCFTCCLNQVHNPQERRRRRRRLDPSMIGSPTNFKHTGHVGTRGMSTRIGDIQNQMASKGGYDYAVAADASTPYIDSED